MKIFKILSHPYTLIFCYCFMVISGESTGGFYIMYILLGLLHGVLHSLLSFYGMLFLVIGFHLAVKRNFVARQALYVIGVAMMVASVFFFFHNDTEHYNWRTFEQGFPMFTLVLASVIAACFLLGIFWKPKPGNGSKSNVLSKV